MLQAAAAMLSKRVFRESYQCKMIPGGVAARPTDSACLDAEVRHSAGRNLDRIRYPTNLRTPPTTGWSARFAMDRAAPALPDIVGVTPPPTISSNCGLEELPTITMSLAGLGWHLRSVDGADWDYSHG